MKKIILIICFGFGLIFTKNVIAENIVFPNDAGIVNVTLPPYNAIADDGKDDTQAIQQALSDHPSGNKIIYLPNGVYNISDTLKWPAGEHGGQAQKRTILQGQSRVNTVLKLNDQAEKFQDKDNPNAILWTGQKPAQRFRNGIRNLTINTGTRNPGAIGIQFIANNQGTIRQVSIISEDGQGQIGLDMSYTDEVGPCLIQDVSVHGFDVGIKSSHAVDSITLERIHLENQNKYGYHNAGQCLSIHDFTSINSIPAFYNEGDIGVVTLIDANIKSKHEKNNHPAIINEAVLLARDIRVEGYNTAIQNEGGHQNDANNLTVDEFVSHEVAKLFPSPDHGLMLPIVDTPQIAWDPLEQWASPTHYGAKPDDDQDDTEAIQKAIDSGKSTVYLPNGRYVIDGTVYIRGKVKRFIGCEGRLDGDGEIRFSDGEASAVIFERFGRSYGSDLQIIHDSERDFIISSCIIGEMYNEGTGKLFIEDVCGGPFTFTKQNVWARQINPEQTTTKITNAGGSLWILGLKTEREGTLVKSTNGARTEIVGGFSYATSEEKTMPMFITENSSLSLTIGESCFNNNPFHQLVKETRGDQTKILKRGEVPGRTGGSMIPLFIGY